MKNLYPRFSQTFFVLFIVIFLGTTINVQAQVSGTVFRDYNGNGTRQNTSPDLEPLVAGIIVNAYNSNDILVASYVTNASGAFSIPATGSTYNGTPGSNTGSVNTGVAIRLEFIIPASGTCGLNPNIDYSTGNGSTVGSSVRFINGGTAGVNYAIQNPADYKGATTNPLTFTNRFSNGDPTVANPGAVNTFLGFPFNNTGNATAPSRTMTAASMGSVWGLAYSRPAGRMFAAAYVRRHWGLNGSSGQIFSITNLASGTITATPFFDFDRGIDNATGGGDDIPTRYNGSVGAITYGTAGHYTITGTAPVQTITYNGATDPVSGLPAGLGVIGTNVQRALPNNTNNTSNDPAAFGQVGRVGLGDIEISDDGRFLYVVNLYDRKLYRLTLNSATNPTAVTAVTSYTLPNPPARSSKGGGFATTYGSATTAFYTGAAGGGYQRPFGLKFWRGKVYVGAVTTGETGGTSTKDNNTGNPEYTDLWAYVWEFDASTAAFNTTPLLQEPQNYNRGINGDVADETWKPWTATLQGYLTSGTQPADSRYYYYAQPMLTGIEFDNDGSMILGFRDRFGDQTGYDQPPLTGPGNGFNGGVPNLSLAIDGIATGDILRVYRNPGSCAFVMEANATAGSITTLGAMPGALNGGQGPSNYTGNNGEFYYQDGIEVFNGGAGDASYWHLNCSEGALAMLPGDANIATTEMDPMALWSNGISKMSNINGQNPNDYQLVAGTSRVTLGKASALGDLEILLPLAPIEIGNRIWNDANGNGIQDAGEAGINGVALQLFVDNNNDGVPDGAAIGTTTTNVSGEWYFNTGNITGDGDPNTAGTQAAITPGIRYLVRPAAAAWTSGAGTGVLLNYRLTATDITGNGAVDLSDNDAVINGTGASAIPQISVLAGNAGENNHNLDFGFKQLASIGNRVWLDQNGNGTQDGTPGTAGYEPGVAGVSVQLFRNGTDGVAGTADDVLVGTTVTDALGNYLFDNLTPTNQTNATTIAQTSYNVKFTPPAKYTFTTSITPGDNGNNTNSDADPNQLLPTYGRTGGYNLTAGETDNTADAGLIFPITQLATIGDRVWLDNGQGGGTANDGLQNGTEAGVSGVTVTLFRDPDGPGILPAIPFATTVTDANGNYLFSNIIPDPTITYQVAFTLPIGFAFSPKDAGADAVDSDVNTSGANFGRTDAFTVPTATNITTVDAGINASALASVGDFVWNDLDQDGVQDAGEPGIAGVTVNLYNSVGVIIATTVTDALGRYQFTGLAAGIYGVGFVAPTGYNFSPQGVGNTWTNSDANTGTGRTGTFTLVAGQRKDDIDAGLSNTNSLTLNKLGDRVWYDNNENGIQDAGEFGVPGVSVSLRDGNGQPVDDPRQTGFQPYIVTTDLNGNYLFTDLPNGNYRALFYNLPAGYSIITSTDAGGATTTNSDASASGFTPVYNLTGGVTNTTVDAGISRGTTVGTASLGNKVFYDLNANGLQDAGETGVAGITVTLRTPGSDGIQGNGDDLTVTSQTTNSLGEYLFTNLPGGVYYVVFSNGPAGYNTSTTDAGSNDAIDSDGAGAVTISSATSSTGLYALGLGEQNLTVDLGLVKTNAARSSISNQVWFDANNNATYDAGTDGVVPGVQVELLDGNGNSIDPDGAGPLTQTLTVTDVNGNYLFDNLVAANYIVKFSNYPAGLFPVLQDATLTNNKSAANGGGNTPVIVLGASQNLTNVDLGLTTLKAVLGDRVWNDINANGQQDSGEPGLAGITVILRDGSGNPVASAITDANGNYLFTNLDAGTYIVEFANIPGNMTFTTKDSGADATDSDVNPGTGRTDAITLTAGQVNLTVDAGIRNQQTATVGTFVWFDNGAGGGISGDGTAQSNEPPVAGVLATLYDAGTNLPLRSAITNSNGEYRFTDVAAGTYYVIFSNLPGPGLAFTTQVAGTTDQTSKANNLGRTPNFTVDPNNTSANNIVYADAGLIGAALPADGLNLFATLNGTEVTLIWKTQSESETDYFEIERSVNNSDFTKVGTRAAAGTSASEKAYDLKENIASVSNNGILYYRVKLYDKNGSSRYSNIAVVRLRNTGIKVWPNPFADVLQVNISSRANATVEVKLSDAAGRIIMIQRRNISAGTNQISISELGKLPKGNYLLEIMNTGDNSKTVFKLSK